jgi:shikimate kinase
VFCLVATVDTVLDRVAQRGEADDRPMLAGDDVRGTVERLLAERAPSYAAFRAIDTDGREPAGIAAEIASLLTA